MAFEFRLPDIGEGVVEGEVVAWKVKVGDVVKLDQPIVEVMTDKATVELPSPRAGRISSIHFTDGQICPVGQILVVIDDGGAGTSAAPAAAKAHAPAPVAVAAVTSPAAAAVVPTSSAGKVEFVDLSGTRAPRAGDPGDAPPGPPARGRPGPDRADRETRPGHLRRRPRRRQGCNHRARRQRQHRAGRPVASPRSASRSAARRSASRCAACASASPRP
jgi:pyruvate/2-oxoglutarate dehydrogenase complex dihydrolipoamide acyltransferase (E2) component